jgi:predicted dehydrogenase
MTHPKVRLGLIGTGFMAQLAHLPSFAALPNCEIAAIASHRPQLAAALAAQYGIPKVYADESSLIQDPDVQAVICIQPFHKHYPLGLEVLRAGKALFTEKPMVTRLDDGLALVDLAERQGLVYGVGFMKRFDPGVQLAGDQIKSFIESGELGELRLIDAHCYLGDWLQGADSPRRSDEPADYPAIERRYPEHVGLERAAAYDYLTEVYSHNLNLIRYLLPAERLECVSAVSTADETWALTLVSGNVLVSLRGAPSASHEWDEVTRFVFARGKVTVRTPAPMNRQAVASVSIYRRDGPSPVEQHLHAGLEWSLARQARAFVAAVSGGEVFAAAGRDSLRDMEIIEHVFRIAQAR